LLQTNNENEITILISFSVIFLDFKFLLFLRVIESIGIYFAVIISVAKQIVSFLVVLLFILFSFAHGFFILLRPKFNYSLDEPTNNDDPNNPWNLTDSYNASNESFIQNPDENTNMFVDFRTAILAMYLFLTGTACLSTLLTFLVNKVFYKSFISFII